jgi:hypothetical protein
MGAAGERIVAGPQAHTYLKDVFTAGAVAVAAVAPRPAALSDGPYAEAG